MTDTAKRHNAARQPSADIINSEVALKRAARKVWEEARLTGLPVVYMQDGEIMHSLDADLAQPGEDTAEAIGMGGAIATRKYQ